MSLPFRFDAGCFVFVFCTYTTLCHGQVHEVEFGDSLPEGWSQFAEGGLVQVENNVLRLRSDQPSGDGTFGVLLYEAPPADALSLRMHLTNNASGWLGIWLRGDGGEYLGTNGGSIGFSDNVFTPTGLGSLTDVVLQLDLLDGVARGWIWSPENPPISESPPLLERVNSVNDTQFRPAVWARDFAGGPVDVSVHSIQYSSSHIPIPEPTAGTLTSFCGLALIAWRKRRGRA